jgi:hypothetical protein
LNALYISFRCNLLQFVYSTIHVTIHAKFNNLGNFKQKKKQKKPKHITKVRKKRSGITIKEPKKKKEINEKIIDGTLVYKHINFSNYPSVFIGN